MTSETFTAGESFTVPSDVSTVDFDLSGEEGQNGGQSGGDPGGGGTGGQGGTVVVSGYAVTPGTTYYFRGSGSAGQGGTGSAAPAGDGGELIDVREAGTALSDQILVAAGGGGGDSGDAPTAGGAGGANTGEGGESEGSAAGGGGGTQSAGGSGFVAGGRGIGGDGEDGFTSGDFEYDGGGGAGGYWGGGGGEVVSSDSSAGGGGSNFVAGGITADTNARGGGTGSASVTVTYAPTPSGVSVDSLTEPSEAAVRVQASATSGYDPDSTWTVYRSTDGSQGSSVHTETGNGALDVTLTSQPTGDVVYYTVELSNSSGTDSAQSSLIVRAATVSGLAVDAHDATSVDISWNPNPGPDVDQYEIHRAEATGSSVVDYAQVDTSASASYSDTGLENGEHYYYIVLATNSGDSSYDSRYPGEVDQITDLPAPTIESTEDVN